MEDPGVAGVSERLAPYDVSDVPGISVPEKVEPELAERAAMLLTIMPPNQNRTTIESLLAPHDPDRGRRAIDALIAAGFAAEDDRGHLRRVG
jgi:hypothetical protein